MKKLLLILVLFLLMQNVLLAQNSVSPTYSYELSSPYKVFDANHKKYFSRGNELMVVKFDNFNNVMIQKFDADKPSFVKEKLYRGFFPKDYLYEEMLQWNDKYYLFLAFWNNREKKQQLFSIEVNFELGEFVNVPKLQCQVDGEIDAFKGDYDNKNEKFAFYQSYDRTKLLVQYTKNKKEKTEEGKFDVIGLIAFDENLNKTSNQEMIMPYSDKMSQNKDYQIDGQGNLYILAEVRNNQRNGNFFISRVEAWPNYHMELFTVEKGSKKMKFSVFDNEGAAVKNLKFFDVGKDFLICGGTYNKSKEVRMNDSDGIVLFKVKADGTIFNRTFHEIPLKLLNQNESSATKEDNEKNEKEGTAKVSALEVNSVIINEDSSMLVIAEISFIVSAGNGQTVSRWNIFSDVYVFKVNGNDTLSWMQKIPKGQSGGKIYMSYKYFSAGDFHYFFFLDDNRNGNLGVAEEPANYSLGKNDCLAAVKISDIDGSLTKSTIFETEKVRNYKIYQFAITRIVRTGKNAFIFEVYKKDKEDLMIKVSLN